MREFRAPGRVNLIGEHTDYNLGFVLPIALSLTTSVRTEPSTHGMLRVSSEQEADPRAWPLDSLASLQPAKHWSDYVAGVARELLARGVAMEPLHLSIASSIPQGAGLSSSAALEVAAAIALLQGRSIDPLEIARLCQRAEVDFVGIPCGIMDQFTAVFGRRGAALKIDCRSLTFEAVTIPEDVEIVAVNSMVSHQLGNSAYRTRVEECAIAVDSLHRRFPEVESLRDATSTQLEEVPMPRIIRRRARHVISENKRVELFCNAAARGALERMGELFFESHRSMRHDYEITCDEIDFLVDTAAGIADCYGARMTGGGFGGCTVNLIAPGTLERFQSAITARYRERFGITPEVFRCLPSDGAREIS